MKIIDFIQDFSCLSVFIRLFIATISGAAIGWERGAHGKSAGIRTFSLVCLGASLVMVINEYLLIRFGSGDPARLGAQVISGVGFLGVGTIIVTGRNHVKGLTTAATLWATACIGIAIGSGYVFGGMMAMVMILFIMTVLAFISRHNDDYASRLVCYIELTDETGIDDIYSFVDTNCYRITSIEKQKKQTLHAGDMALMIKIDLKKRMKHENVTAELLKLPSVHYIEEIH